MRPLACLSLALLACTDPADKPHGDGPETPSETTPDPVPEPLVLTVRTLDQDLVTDPIEGATVAIDDATGVRREVVTGADGVARFDLLWEEEGPIDVTVDPGLPDVPVVTRLGLARADAEQLPWLFYLPHEDPDPVDVTGTVAGRDPEKWMSASILAPGGTSGNFPAADFSLALLPGHAFDVVVAEYTASWDEAAGTYLQPTSNWVRVRHDAVAADTDIAVDLADAVPATVGSVRLDLPQSLRNNGGYPWAVVFSQGFPVPIGWTVAAQRSGDAFDLDLAWLPAPDDVVLTAVGKDAGPAGYSWRNIAGSPDTWTEDEVALDPLPDLDTSGPLPAMGPFVFADPPEDASVGVSLYAGPAGPWATRIPLWQVVGARGASRIVVPEPPSSFDATALTEPGLERVVAPMIVRDGDSTYYTSGSMGAMISLD
jgi:hypothetical protein